VLGGPLLAAEIGSYWWGTFIVGIFGLAGFGGELGFCWVFLSTSFTCSCCRPLWELCGFQSNLLIVLAQHADIRMGPLCVIVVAGAVWNSVFPASF
jgi:hypothetical protein